MSVIRIKHNRENPYVLINKEIFRNKKISLKAIGLWAKCLSMPDDWKFYVKYLASSGKEGRRAIYSAIDELIEAGYAIRMEHYEKKEDGKFMGGGVEYIFFEFLPTEEEKANYIEEFKKSFRQCGFGDRRDGDLRNVPLLNKEEEQIKEEETNITSEVSDDPFSQFVPKKLPPEEAHDLANYLLVKRKEAFPKMKGPNLEEWIDQIDKMNRLDKRAWDDIRRMIDWAYQSSFWHKNILSASTLRKQYDKMLAQKEPVMTKEDDIKRNRDIARKIQDFLKADGKVYSLRIYNDEVYCPEKNDSIRLDLPTDTFENILLNWYKMEKK